MEERPMHRDLQQGKAKGAIDCYLPPDYYYYDYGLFLWFFLFFFGQSFAWSVDPRQAALVTA